MILGPIIICQCPKCDNLISNESLSSGNTLGSNMYSDGKRTSPMLPVVPNLTKCSKCNTILWLSKAKEVGRQDYGENIKNDWTDVQMARFLSIKEYFTALETQIAETNEEELYIRKRIWWAFNDRIEKGRIAWGFYDPEQDNKLFLDTETTKTLWLENANRLLDILDPTDVNQLILIAELSRNLGNFEKCLAIIDSIANPDLNRLKAAFKKECEDQNKNVFQLL